jgi:hypothetical protein
MADEITLEQDVDEVLGGLQTVEADVTGAPAGRSDFEPEDGPEEDEEEHSDGGRRRRLGASPLHRPKGRHTGRPFGLLVSHAGRDVVAAGHSWRPTR